MSSRVRLVGRRFRDRCVVLWSQVTLTEISGSFGDLGTFIPLFVALGRKRAIYAVPSLFFAGVSNLATGFAWDVPMPVQPMKAICAVALIDALTREQVTTAGIGMVRDRACGRSKTCGNFCSSPHSLTSQLMFIIEFLCIMNAKGALLLLLGLTNGINWVNRIVPNSIVSGMQIGVGLSLAIHGVDTVASLPTIGVDSILLAVACSLLCLYLLREDSAYVFGDDTNRGFGSNIGSRRGANQVPSRSDGVQLSNSYASDSRRPCVQIVCRPPVGVALFLLGVIIAVVDLIFNDDGDNSEASSFKWTFSPWSVATWSLHGVTSKDWKAGLLQGTLPQLPLSTLNSVISVCCLASSLYPDKRRRDAEESANDAVLSRREVCVSVGLMNLLLVPFGAMPNCHGAGGLAGQHKFGECASWIVCKIT